MSDEIKLDIIPDSEAYEALREAFTKRQRVSIVRARDGLQIRTGYNGQWSAPLKTGTARGGNRCSDPHCGCS